MKVLNRKFKKPVFTGLKRKPFNPTYWVIFTDRCDRTTKKVGGNNLTGCMALAARVKGHVQRADGAIWIAGQWMSNTSGEVVS